MSDRRKRGESGAILIIFMVALTVAAIALGASVQAWSKIWRRDTEDELIFRANQYVDGIVAYRKEHGGQFPLKLEDLYKPGPRRLRYVRHLYKDPLAKDGKWGLLYLMPGGQGVYDPKAAQKAQEKAAKDWGSNWETAGTGDLAQPQNQGGVTPINPNLFGAGAPGAGGVPAGGQPPIAIQGNLPPIPSAQEGGLKDGEESVTEPPIGWPIVGVISRASGKAAEATFKIYKGHEQVDEWQFHVFDRGEQVQMPGNPGMRPAPMGVGPGIGGRPYIQGIGGQGGGRSGGRLGGWDGGWGGPKPGGLKQQMYPEQQNQGNDNP